MENNISNINKLANQNNALQFQRESKYYLSIVAIIKNEALYIEEWLDYHIKMGVEHFYIYDNDSTDNIQEILKPYINNNYITYAFLSGIAQQRKAYDDAVLKYKHDTRWLALLDIDEFICPVENISIPTFLKDYEAYPALGINWLLFDSNNHKIKPDSPVLLSYTRIHENFYNFDANKHIKSIIDPVRTTKCEVHHAIYSDNTLAVNENYEAIEEYLTAGYTINKIRINHYFTKSLEEFCIKRERGCADNGRLRPMEHFYSHSFPNSHLHDYTIIKHTTKN